QKYRVKEEIEAAKGKDCIADFEKKLIKDKALARADVKKIRENVQKRIDDAVNFARESPFPDESELMDDLYV
ncbi:MAG: pyruvate dehydrogenase (acetyl-transferring) E1 component subunit alpha, partial [Deltaproteobacteria bacterium]|nr:pyruvate dehydrogenase (acetyl-transferring) E1 component subunit alpha [Deltaproteobacteria bacterium]MBW2203913.1 pyruvate dehydrogenase (acetyl-transferring) E1 component subunit alpha [Deltaproteobacteria bacterium]